MNSVPPEMVLDNRDVVGKRGGDRLELGQTGVSGITAVKIAGVPTNLMNILTASVLRSPATSSSSRVRKSPGIGAREPSTMNGGSYTASLAIAGMRLAASRGGRSPGRRAVHEHRFPGPCCRPGQHDQRLEVIDLPVGRVGPTVAAGAAAPADRRCRR